MKLRNLLYIVFALFLSIGIVSCSDDELGETIFPDVDETIDPNSYSFQLDSFLKREYLEPYNLDYKYKMEDVGTDMNYNLVPARSSVHTGRALSTLSVRRRSTRWQVP